MGRATEKEICLPKGRGVTSKLQGTKSWMILLNPIDLTSPAGRGPLLPLVQTMARVSPDVEMGGGGWRAVPQRPRVHAYWTEGQPPHEAVCCGAPREP